MSSVQVSSVYWQRPPPPLSVYLFLTCWEIGGGGADFQGWYENNGREKS